MTEYITLPAAIRATVPNRLDALEWSRLLKKRWYRFCEEHNEHIREVQIDNLALGVRKYKALPSPLVHQFLCQNWEWGKNRIIERVIRNCDVMKKRLSGDISDHSIGYMVSCDMDDQM
jgi:hypothetical protein